MPWFEQQIPVEKPIHILVDSGMQTAGTVMMQDLQSTKVSLTSLSSVVSDVQRVTRAVGDESTTPTSEYTDGVTTHECVNIETVQSPDQQNIISLIESKSNEYIFDQHKDTFLYIQMELCDMTLNDWIELRDFQISGVSSRISKTNVRNMKKEILAIIKNKWISPKLGDERIPDKDQCYNYIQHSPTNRLLEGIIKGLRYLHGEEVAHQDLHLNNVLIVISDHGEITPRISDFSDALTIDFVSTRQQNCENISPEARENDNISPKSHTYSSLYECKENMEKLGIIIQKLFCYTKNNHDDFESRWPIHAGWIEELKKSSWERPTATMILRKGMEAGIFESKDQKELEQMRREENMKMKLTN